MENSVLGKLLNQKLNHIFIILKKGSPKNEGNSDGNHKP